MEFAIFDIETRIDKQLLNRVFFAHDNISDDEALSALSRGFEESRR